MQYIEEVERVADRLSAKPEAVERLRLHRWHLWHVLRTLYADADPSLLDRWRRAPEGSQEWRWAMQHDQALELLTAEQDSGRGGR